jgi:hypothetical protein
MHTPQIQEVIALFLSLTPSQKIIATAFLRKYSAKDPGLKEDSSPEDPPQPLPNP